MTAFVIRRPILATAVLLAACGTHAGPKPQTAPPASPVPAASRFNLNGDFDLQLKAPGALAGRTSPCEVNDPMKTWFTPENPPVDIRKAEPRPRLPGSSSAGPESLGGAVPIRNFCQVTPK